MQMDEIELVKKYMRILFGNAPGNTNRLSSTSKRNIKMLKNFASLVEDEMPELYHQTLSRILDYDILRYYEERQPVAVAIAMINDKIEEFIYSEQDTKMQVIRQTLSLIGADKYQSHDILEHILSLYFSDSMKKSSSKQNGVFDTKTKSKIREKRERKASKMDKITNMLHKIGLFKDQISKGFISADIDAFWTEVEDYLRREIQSYEKLKNKTKQYDASESNTNSVEHV